MAMKNMPNEGRAVRVGALRLAGECTLVPGALGVTVFVHGSGSSHRSPRNRFVASVLHGWRLSTLLFDLLTDDEAMARAPVFDIDLLAARLQDALAWWRDEGGDPALPVGLFGASTGAAAALRVAALPAAGVTAVVSRGGRTDLAGDAVGRVRVPTLLIVGSLDTEVLRLNRETLRALQCPKRLEVVPGASHLFDEPGTLETAAHLAGEWLASAAAAPAIR